MFTSVQIPVNWQLIYDIQGIVSTSIFKITRNKLSWVSNQQKSNVRYEWFVVLLVVVLVAVVVVVGVVMLVVFVIVLLMEIVGLEKNVVFYLKRNTCGQNVVISLRSPRATLYTHAGW